MGNGQSSSVTKRWQTETAPLPSPGPSHPRPLQEGPPSHSARSQKFPKTQLFLLALRLPQVLQGSIGLSIPSI